MQAIPFSVVLFYYGVMAFGVAVVMVVTHSLITGQSVSIFSYSKKQYSITLGSCILNFLGLVCNCIAMQNDNPAFLSILGYSSLLYAFLADTFIFHVDF